MARPARNLPRVAKAPSAALHRRRQQVVVRAAGSAWPTLSDEERRTATPTLPGLGFRAEADTLPALFLDLGRDDYASPVSGIRTIVAPRAVTVLPPPVAAAPRAAPSPAPLPAARAMTLLPPPPSTRRRPDTLLDEVHDTLSRQYLAEAERLVASGIFDATDDLW